MAKINKTDIYPFRNPSPEDFVVGTKVDENGRTVSFSILEIASIAGSIVGNSIIRISDIEIVEGVLYVRNSEISISEWIINNVIYTDDIERSFAIEDVTENFFRNDLLVVNDDPEEPFTYIVGQEDITNYIEPEYDRINSIKVIPIYINGTDIELGLINIGNQFISKSSEDWTYLFTVDENPVLINTSNYKNFIVWKDLEHTTTITHSVNPFISNLKQWSGWLHRIGRAVGGAPVIIKHNAPVDMLDSSEQAYFFPNGEDYELREGEILTFSSISKNIYLGEMLHKNTYVPISSNMSGGQVFEDNITVSLLNGKTIGKYTNGETIPCAGWTPEQWARDVSIEYLTPSFTSFSMQGQATTVEVGTVISGNKNFTFGFDYADNIKNGTISIVDVTASNVLASGLPKTSPQTANVGTITKSSVSNNQWRATAENTMDQVLQSSLFTITWNFRCFSGSVSEIPTTGTQVRSSLLSTSIISNGNSLTFKTGTVNRRFVIAIPSHKTLVEAKNMGTNENLPFTLSDTITTVPDVSNTPRNYKVYILENAVPFSSDYTINITLS